MNDNIVEKLECAAAQAELIASGRTPACVAVITHQLIKEAIEILKRDSGVMIKLIDKLLLIQNYTSFFGLRKSDYDDFDDNMCFYGNCKDGKHSELCKTLEKTKKWFDGLDEVARCKIAELVLNQ